MKKFTPIICMFLILLLLGCISEEEDKALNAFNLLTESLGSSNPAEKCDMISSETTYILNIKNLCYSISAELNNDPLLCKKINDSFHKKDCLKTIKNYKPLERCSKNNNSEVQSTECELINALSKKDINTCDLFQDEKRDNCIYGYSTINLNSDNCKLLNNSNLIDNCYNNIGIDTKNSELCAFISNQSKMSTCFIDILNLLFNEHYSYDNKKTQESVQYCDSIANINIKDNCYKTLAIITPTQPELCYNILNQPLKDDCLDYTKKILFKNNP